MPRRTSLLAPLLHLAAAAAVLALAPGCPDTSGKCAADEDCATGRACCGGTCLDVKTDPSNCGGCGNVCDYPNSRPSCLAGLCQLRCNAGFGNCNVDKQDGCEVSLADTATSCGACDTVCTFAHAAATCAASRCAPGACEAGYQDCDADPATGCETDTRVELRHCGACAAACAPAHATGRCAASACLVDTCAADWGDCDGAPGNGCERSLTDDAAHCGRCGAACGPQQACLASRCRANQLVVFGGATGFSPAAPTAEAHAFDLLTKTFALIPAAAPAGAPPARWRHAAAWDEPRNRMVVWGGLDGSGVAAPGDVWALEFATSPPAWRRVATTGPVPAPRVGPAYALDPATSRLYVFGGMTDTGAGLSDLSTFDLSTDTWASVHGSGAAGAPGNRVNAMGAFDPARRRFLVFGGTNALSRVDLGELWQLDVGAGAWVATPLTGGPFGRGLGVLFDGSPAHLFGGVVGLLAGSASMAGDFNSLDVGAASPWTSLGAVGPAARYNAGRATRDGTLYLFAGGVLGGGGPSTVADLWSYAPSSQAWTRVSDGTGTFPAGRLGASVVAR